MVHGEENGRRARSRYAVLTKVALLGVLVAAVAGGPMLPGDALAQSAPAPKPSPSASPAPVPSPAPKKKASRLHVKIDSYTSGVNNQFVGPGATGSAEAPSFAAGGPLAPSVPYDFFTGSPTVTGQSIAEDLIITPTYRLLDNLDVTVSFGYGSVGGTGNVGSYWGGSLFPTINPHLGSQAFQIAPAFPTHNGQDSVTAQRVSVLDGQFALHDGRGALTGGWFNLKQTLSFVFQQAPWTNTPTQLAPQLPQSLGDGTAAVDVFQNEATILPLHGYDLWGKVHDFTFEATNADLPAAAGTTTRESSLSGVYTAGQFTFSAEVAHLTQSGATSARVLFGSSPSITLDGAAAVPSSTVLGQQMAIEGFGAAFPIGTVDATLNYGHSCYSANGVAAPSASCTSGNYVYGRLHQGFTAFDLGLELVRFEPQYAPALLNYGTEENVWSAPFARPGTWLAGTYSFVDTSQVGANRQGFRLTTTFLVAGVETRLAYAHYTQISPYDLTTGAQVGFIEPYFSPQISGQGVLGTEDHVNAWLAWHPKFADVTLELGDVTTNRTTSSPTESISIDYPSAVLSLSRRFGKVLGGVGAGRYAVEGSYDTVGVKNADLQQNVVFAGVQYQANANSAYGLEYQLFSVSGSPLIPNGLSPAYHGPQLQFFQRLKT
jgi:hypothetical protein